MLTSKFATVADRLRRNLTAVNALRWHGLVLTLSQLLFHRSPPPDQLPSILNALVLALSFEQRSATGRSVGTSVRDAACFGIWYVFSWSPKQRLHEIGNADFELANRAVARRYTTKELQTIDTSTIRAGSGQEASTSILQILANELVTAATLDSAGNIRRGASAALQELIGRHPDTIDHGISVVQVVDYHAVALRSRAMMEVAVSASKLSSTYWLVILDGLLEWRGIGSPDVQSRRDTATTIGFLCVSQIEKVLKRVRHALQFTKDTQIEERHALLLSLAAIVKNIEKQIISRSLYDNLTAEDCSYDFFRDLPLTQRHFTSPALKPFLTAEAISCLVLAVGRASRVSVSFEKILKAGLSKRIEELQWSLQQYKDDLVIKAASEAMYELFSFLDDQAQNSLILLWISSLNGPKRKPRQYGIAMALGYAFPYKRLNDRLVADKIRDTLLSQAGDAEIETKVWTLRSLKTSILITAGTHIFKTFK